MPGGCGGLDVGRGEQLPSGGARVDEITSIPSFDSYLPALGAGRDAFVKQFPEPFLIFDAGGEIFTKGVGVDTINLASTSDDGPKPKRGRNAVAIRKRPGANPFAGMITVGRAPNNDIPLLVPSLSKFHAYFVKTPQGQLGLCDAGSKNGTKLRGEQLPVRGSPTIVNDGDMIQFGKGVHARVMDSTSFAILLATLYPMR